MSSGLPLPPHHGVPPQPVAPWPGHDGPMLDAERRRQRAAVLVQMLCFDAAPLALRADQSRTAKSIVMRSAMSSKSWPRTRLTPIVAVVILAVLASVQHTADAKVYGRCDLASALKTKGIATKDIATWVCIGERLSSIDTETATDPDDDPDGTVYHGVFLISDKWWCNQGKKGCGVTCEQMKNSLESNIECAKKVFTETKRLKKNGFKAWGAYDDCQNPESYVRGCPGLDEDEDDVDVTIHRRTGLPDDS